ncbi:MAG: zeta toxin family protein [Sulfuricurvum sp.]
MNKMGEYSNQEFIKAIKEAWSVLVIEKNATPGVNPQGFVIGGQPGAGKSSLVKKLLKDNKNLVSIDADILKTFHPRYDTIQEIYPQDAHDLLKNFSGKLKDTITDMALEGKYSVIIESTFRDPQVPKNILTQLKEGGYETTVLVQTCSSELSWNSCLARERITGRAVDKEFHDNVVKNLSKHIKEVAQTGLADHMQVFARVETRGKEGHFEQQEIYNNATKKVPNSATIDKYILGERHKRQETSSYMGR